MRISAALACACLLLCAAPAGATGGYDDEDDLEPLKIPESPDDFIAGRLGILTSGLYPRWRGVAFRVLAGPPFDAATRTALTNPLRDEKLASPAKEWLAARAAIADVPAPAHLPDVGYGYAYDNCYADAFTTATTSLRARVQRFGAASKDVREWLTAQDQVFSNCDDPTPVIPAEHVAAGSHPSLQQDRDYQVAAALFYARRFAEARTAFERVAADRSSPWAGFGRFAVARALLRQGTAGDKNDDALLTQAESLLAGVLADRNAASLHASARRLQRFVAFRTRPDSQLPVMGELLAHGAGDELGLVLTDFAWLAEKQPTPMTPPDLDPFAKSEITEWTLAWQLGDVDRTARAVTRWHERHSLPWLLLALASVAPDHPDARGLLDEARKVKPGTPGYATIALHRARLLVGQKRLPAARALLDEALAQPDLPRDARNQLTRARYQLARTVDEALGFMLRDVTPEESGRLEPAAASVFLQYLPIAESARVASDPRLPQGIRAEILFIAWLRAALLDDVALAQTVATALGSVDDKERRALTAAFAAASTAEERRYVIVHRWLRDPTPLYLYAAVTGDACGDAAPSLRVKSLAPPPFVDAALQARARSESQRLTALVGEPATFRALQTASWASAHKSDPRVPEDLHLAVNGTKQSCDKKATAASKRAWKVLHDLFPANEWTRKTRYWYP